MRGVRRWVALVGVVALAAGCGGEGSGSGAEKGGGGRLSVATGGTSGVAAPVEGGALDSKAVSMPKAVVSEEAKRLKLSGRVVVKVLVDESGKVVSAVAQNGPAALREAAEAAAREATFALMTQGGITVRVSGTLTYDFPKI